MLKSNRIRVAPAGITPPVIDLRPIATPSALVGRETRLILRSYQEMTGRLSSSYLPERRAARGMVRNREGRS